MDDIARTIDLLEPHVRMVNAEAFIELLHMNVKPLLKSSPEQIQ